MNQGHHPPRSTSTLPGLLLAALVVGAIGCTPILDTDDLTSSEIGDADAGEALFVQKTCVSCHAYDGQGGDDAPPLDYMRDRLSARQLANMSGTIWNHLPKMLTFFNEEGIPVPTFAGNEMADLLAYLHGGPPSEVGTGRSGTHVGGRNMPSNALGSALLGQEV